MSLVGTRPPTVDEWEKYELHHRSRMSIKPGITGMWQVSGRSDITDKVYILLTVCAFLFVLLTSTISEAAHFAFPHNGLAFTLIMLYVLLLICDVAVYKHRQQSPRFLPPIVKNGVNLSVNPVCFLRSVNFYFTDESEPSLVIISEAENRLLFSHLYLSILHRKCNR